MNTLLNGWSRSALPSYWTAGRNHWEPGHAIHAALFGTLFSALLMTIPLDRRRETET